jgi:hypothetical protein
MLLDISLQSGRIIVTKVVAHDKETAQDQHEPPQAFLHGPVQVLWLQFIRDHLHGFPAGSVVVRDQLVSLESLIVSVQRGFSIDCYFDLVMLIDQAFARLWVPR